MDAQDIYRWLTGGAANGSCDGFDAHVVAAIVSLGMIEAQSERRPIVEAVGLSGAELAALIRETFPHAGKMFDRLAEDHLAELSEDEVCLRDLLWRSATDASDLQRRLAQMVARRSMRPNHLWQDLGLRNRRELSWLMARHFEPLASRNRQDMKWKKFLYRTICRDEGYRLCSVPVCSDCDDFELCFGDESGESLLARSRQSSTPRLRHLRIVSSLTP